MEQVIPVRRTSDGRLIVKARDIPQVQAAEVDLSDVGENQIIYRKNGELTGTSAFDIDFGQMWSTFPSNLDGEVLAMVRHGNIVYLGGSLIVEGDNTRAGGFVYSYDIVSRQLALIAVANDKINALAMYGTTPALHAGGNFTKIGSSVESMNSSDIKYVARLQNGAWSSVGVLNGNCYALAVHTIDGVSYLCAGGEFTTAGTEEVGYVARWDGSAWSNLDRGFNDVVRCLIVSNGFLYAGGLFTESLNDTIDCDPRAFNRVARYDPCGNWQPLNMGLNGTLTPSCNAFATDGTSLYIGGDFTLAGGNGDALTDAVASRNVVKYDYNSTTKIGTFTAIGDVQDEVLALAVYSDALYAGGYFTTVKNGDVIVQARFVASRSLTGDSPVWVPVDDGFSAACRSLLTLPEYNGQGFVISSSLLAGGMFRTAGSSPSHYATELWNNVWRPLGNGATLLTSSTTSSNPVTPPISVGGSINSIALGNEIPGVGREVFVAGDFTNIGAASISYIAKFTPTANGEGTWTQVGDSIFSSGINKIQFVNNILYACDSAGFYRLDGSEWVKLDHPSLVGIMDFVHDENDSDPNSTTFYVAGDGCRKVVLDSSLQYTVTSVGRRQVPIEGNTYLLSFSSIAMQGDTLYLGTSPTSFDPNQVFRTPKTAGTNDPFTKVGILEGNISSLVFFGTKLYLLGEVIYFNENPGASGSWEPFNPVPGASGSSIGQGFYASVSESAMFITASNGLYKVTQEGITEITQQPGRAIHISGNNAYVAFGDIAFVVESFDITAESPTFTNIQTYTPLATTDSSVAPGKIRSVVKGSGTDVFVGGLFTSVGGISAVNVARWNTATNLWTQLSMNEADEVFALVFHNGVLYAGTATGVWRTSTTGSPSWTRVGSNVGPVRALALQTSPLTLYASGTFADGVARIANPDSATGEVSWTRVGADFTTAENAEITSLAFIPAPVPFLYAGLMLPTVSATTNRLYRIKFPHSVADTEAWNGIPIGTDQKDVLTLIPRGEDVYIGTTIGVYRYTNCNIQTMGTNFTGENVEALEFDTDGNLYAGTYSDNTDKNGVFVLPKCGKTWEHLSGATTVKTLSLMYNGAEEKMYIGSDTEAVFQTQIPVSAIYTYIKNNSIQVQGKTEALAVSIVPTPMNPAKPLYADSTIWHDGSSFVFGNTTKTFVINHPHDKARLLVHACLEGPEAGVYYRGKETIQEDGKVLVQLPAYAKGVGRDFTLTATPIDKPVPVAASAYDAERGAFTVYGPAGTQFHWMSIGLRQEIEVEPLADAVQVQGQGPYRWIQQ